MRKVTAVLPPLGVESMFEELVGPDTALVMLSNVRGFGRNCGRPELYRGAEYVVHFPPRIKLELLVECLHAEVVTQTLQELSGRADARAVKGRANLWTEALEDVAESRSGVRLSGIKDIVAVIPWSVWSSTHEELMEELRDTALGMTWSDVTCVLGPTGATMPGRDARRTWTPLQACKFECTVLGEHAPSAVASVDWVVRRARDARYPAWVWMENYICELDASSMGWHAMHEDTASATSLELIAPDASLELIALVAPSVPEALVGWSPDLGRWAPRLNDVGVRGMTLTDVRRVVRRSWSDTRRRADVDGGWRALFRKRVARAVDAVSAVKCEVVDVGVRSALTTATTMAGRLHELGKGRRLFLKELRGIRGSSGNMSL
jgi:nitrogen regulatory protein PII